VLLVLLLMLVLLLLAELGVSRARLWDRRPA